MLVLGRRREQEIIATIPPSGQPQTIRFRILRAPGTVRVGLEASSRDIQFARPEAGDQETGRAA